MTADPPLLDVRDLRTEYHTEDGTVVAADNLSFNIERGETFGLVGESGAGKSVTARSILRLIESPGEIAGGEVRYDGDDLLTLSPGKMRNVRGSNIALIPQDPLSALNPVLKTGEQIIETILEHQDVDREEARAQAIQAMDDVGIPDAENRIDDYPHEFSGGMRQRVLIAIALSCNPDVLIADEPTTALDVTTEAKILDLLNDLQEERDLAILLITHDLGVVAQTCDRVGVMYAGTIVERAPVETLFADPQHPYSRALIDSIPDLATSRKRLQTLPGAMPDLTQLPEGCNFAPRCDFATEACRTGNDPSLEPAPNGVSGAACIRKDEIDLSAPRDPDAAHDTPAAHTPDAKGDPVSNDGGVSTTTASSTAQPNADSTAPTAADADTGLAADTTDGEALLEVKGLRKYFTVGDGLLDSLSFARGDGGLPTIEHDYVKAVDGVSFTIDEGETVGLVGESGCGKSTVAETVLQLQTPTDGEVYFKGKPLHELGDREIRSLRQDMQMIFQDPQGSLNPRKSVGQIIGRALEKHDIATGDEKRERTKELLERVGLSGDNIDQYPHEFSGGQQQRVAIAHAIAVEPDLIVCDEPVSALDVSVQAQILNLLEDLQDDFGIAYLFISHNISVVKHICDRIAVMYLGEIMEFGMSDQIFAPPYHPYTESLLSAVPEADPTADVDRILLEGNVPSPADPPSGCSFHTRCPKYIEGECDQIHPALESKRGEPPNHKLACILDPEELNSDRLGALKHASRD